MQQLYVVEFLVEAADQGDAWDRLLSHCARWLDSPAIDDTSFASAGESPLPAVGHRDESRNARWESVAVPGGRGFRLDVLQEVGDSVRLSTRVSIVAIDESLSFRVTLSREGAGGSLTPVRDTPVFQPGVVLKVASDRVLRLVVAGQRIDDRFEMIRAAGEGTALVEALEKQSRLPVLLLHAATAEQRQTAGYLARRLIGLARVVTLNSYTRTIVMKAFPALNFAPGGAVLVWSDAKAPGIGFLPDRLMPSLKDELRGQIMAQIAPLSALTRGSDIRWAALQRQAQAAARAVFESRIDAAKAASDVVTERDVLAERVVAVERENRELEELANTYAADVDRNRALAERTEQAESEANYWRKQHFAHLALDSSAEEADIWTTVPTLTAKKDPEDTFEALSEAADHRIVFTQAAAKSWRKIDYPDAAGMTEALIALAKAACLLYKDGSNDETIGRVDDWFKTAVGLNVATSDDTIEKDKNMRYFDFDGQSWDQKNHVKVRDGVKPNEVGRIHFAFDKEGNRLIVNHVALKLYGI